jgi:hypothetical protein
LCLVILLSVPIIGVLQGNYIRASLALAQFENYLQAPVVLLLFILALQRAPHGDVNGLFSRLTVILLCMLALNTLFSLYLVLHPASELINVFAGSRMDLTTQSRSPGLSVTELTVASGRIAGVFGQVYEAGYAYSLGLFLWVFNYKGTGKGVWLPYCLLLLILTGGLLTFSKVFLVGGLPLFLLSLGIKHILGFSFFLIAFVTLGLTFNGFSLENIGDLRGLWGVSRLLNVDLNNFFAVYTSGRFSDDSIILPSIINILNNSPFSGLGYGSIETSDFSFYEVISLGGLIGLIAFLTLHTLFIGLAFHLKKGRPKTLYLNVLAITFLAEIGAPVITANRVSIFFWLIVAWVLCSELIKNQSASRTILKTHSN